MLWVLSLPAYVGSYCNRTWDGWLCWADSAPGTVLQMCPSYFQDFDPSGEAISQMHTHIYTQMIKQCRNRSKLYLIFTMNVFLLKLDFLTSSTEKVTKVCNPDGQWFHHPESHRVWTNYTQCQTSQSKLKVGHGTGELQFRIL